MGSFCVPYFWRLQLPPSTAGDEWSPVIDLDIAFLSRGSTQTNPCTLFQVHTLYNKQQQIVS